MWQSFHLVAEVHPCSFLVEERHQNLVVDRNHTLDLEAEHPCSQEGGHRRSHLEAPTQLLVAAAHPCHPFHPFRRPSLAVRGAIHPEGVPYPSRPLTLCKNKRQSNTSRRNADSVTSTTVRCNRHTSPPQSGLGLGTPRKREI